MLKTETLNRPEKTKSEEATAKQIVKISKNLIKRTVKLDTSSKYEQGIDTKRGVEVSSAGSVSVVQEDPYYTGDKDTIRLFNSSREEGKSTEIVANANSGRLNHGVRSVNPTEWVDIYNNPNPDVLAVRSNAAEQLSSLRNVLAESEQARKN
jgi:hypothetical protein